MEYSSGSNRASNSSARPIWNYEPNHPGIVRHEVLLPINSVYNILWESQSWNIINVNKSHWTSQFNPFFFSSWSWTAYLNTIFSLILIGCHVQCSWISLASGICHLIFIGSFTVRFDLSDYKLLVIGQVKSDSFKVTIAKLSSKISAVKNQSYLSIVLLTQL